MVTGRSVEPFVELWIFDQLFEKFELFRWFLAVIAGKTIISPKCEKVRVAVVEVFPGSFKIAAFELVVSFHRLEEHGGQLGIGSGSRIFFRLFEIGPGGFKIIFG